MKSDDDLRIVLTGDRTSVRGLHSSTLTGELEMSIWGVGERTYMRRLVSR